MSCDLKTVLQGACSNDFLQLANTDPKLSRAVVLQLLCNISGSLGTTIKTFSSALLPISNTVSQSSAHGLGAVPKMFSAVLVCATAENGYSIGDEIKLEDVVTSQEANQSLPGFCTSADATNVQVQVNNSGFSSIQNILNVGTAVPPKGGGAGVALTPANWRIRFDALLY